VPWRQHTSNRRCGVAVTLQSLSVWSLEISLSIRQNQRRHTQIVLLGSDAVVSLVFGLPCWRSICKQRNSIVPSVARIIYNSWNSSEKSRLCTFMDSRHAIQLTTGDQAMWSVTARYRAWSAYISWKLGVGGQIH